MKITARIRPEDNWQPDENGCHIWQGYTDTDGYGLISARRDDGIATKVKAHIYFWTKTNGPVPEGRILRHTCDVRRCVNEKHVIPGTHAQNTQDMMERGRHRGQHGRPLSLSQKLAVAESNRRRATPSPR